MKKVLYSFNINSENLIIDDSITEIADLVFSYSKISSISFSKNLEKIGKFCFYGCKNLTKIFLPESLKTIKEGAFSDCTNLETVFIPKDIKNIYKDAFKNTKIKALNFYDKDSIYEVPLDTFFELDEQVIVYKNDDLAK